MFNVKHAVDRVVDWLDESLDDEAYLRLGRFARWLEEEAAPAGGIGSGDIDRIGDRHLADSLTFAVGLAQGVGSILDAGSGVGLPGIPLGILRPLTHFTLWDRSGRRTDLAERGTRVLGLTNVSVVQADLESAAGQFDAVVMRAVYGPEQAFPHLSRLLRPGGQAVMGLSRSKRQTVLGEGLASSAHRLGLRLEKVEVPVLDSPASLLRITRNDPV